MDLAIDRGCTIDLKIQPLAKHHGIALAAAAEFALTSLPWTARTQIPNMGTRDFPEIGNFPTSC